MPEKKWSRGRSVNGAKQIPGTTTDCSGWAPHIPTTQWSRGKSIDGAIPIPGTITDCSKWAEPSPVWIAVEVTYAVDTPKDVVARHTFALIAKLRALAPDLGLEYDESRSSESAHERSMVVAISPTAVIPDLEERLYALLPMVRKADRTVPVTGVDIRWDQPLAA